MEGAKRFTGSYSHLTADEAKKSSALSAFLGLGEGASVSYVTMTNNVIIGPNCYIFSMSGGYSPQDHEKWHEQEGYDTCYKIIAPNTFFRRVTRSLNTVRPVKFLGLFQVHYYDEKHGMDYFDPRNSHPAFALKDHDGFSVQKEVRAVWSPLITTQDIEPINLLIRQLPSYVEFHNSLKKPGP